MSLNLEDLHVQSFATAEAADRSIGTADSADDPNCIVYISDCVSCFPEPTEP
jgi:hypothetical protein